MKAAHEPRLGALSARELDNLVEMVRSGALPDKIDELVKALLDSRNAITSWEAERRKAGTTTLLFGSHRLFELLHSGESYEVLLGQHLFTGRIDIVKVARGASSSLELRQQYLRKLRVQSSLHSARFAEVYDAGYARAVDFTVFEFIKGIDLRALVRARGPLTMHEASVIVAETAAALGVLHALGLVYGFIDPSKIIVEDNRTVKLCDVGAAEAPGEIAAIHSKSGRAIDFLSPEAVAGAEVGLISDIYSLGCILYYCVTSKVPFPGTSEARKREAHMRSYPLDPRRLADGLDDAFVDIIAAMMAKEAADRVESAQEVVARLKPWMRENEKAINRERAVD